MEIYGWRDISALSAFNKKNNIVKLLIEISGTKLLNELMILKKDENYEHIAVQMQMQIYHIKSTFQ